MVSLFKTLKLKSLGSNLFSMLDDDWMLVTAGKINSFNTMTASWGGFGILWSRPVAFVFIRPQRYTLGFIENEEYFTLSFFNEEFRSILNFCGSHSGRDVDKIAECSLKPLETGNGAIFFEQAQLIMECRKLYSDQIKPGNFSIQDIEKKVYRHKDYHFFYIAEIVTCMTREGGRYGKY
jgi:flavin reductase (DIM6/NTAB) family NADH-FMN oxidoreductase RutF